MGAKKGSSKKTKESVAAEVKNEVIKDEKKNKTSIEPDYSHLSKENRELLKKENDQFNIIRLKVKQKYGREVMVLGEDRCKMLIPRFSTGSFWLDYSTNGGVPRGRFSMLWGAESTSKTTVALKVMADAQMRNKETHEYLDMKDIEENYTFNTRANAYIHKTENKVIKTYKCHFMDIEGAFDPEWAKCLGVNTDAMDYSAPDHAEQAVDLIQMLINDGKTDLLIVDSIAMMSPSKEIEKAAGEALPGLAARLLNEAWRKFLSDLNGIDQDKRLTVLLINQRREKIGIMFGNPETRPGGNGQKFITSLEIKTSNGKVMSLDDENKYPLWQEMKGTINKNKVGPPKIDYSFNLAVNDYVPPGGEDDEEDGEEDKKKVKKKYPIPFKKGDILEHSEVVKHAYAHGILGKDEEKKMYFVKLLAQEPIYFQKRETLLNEWIYHNHYHYTLVKRDLLLIMTGKV